MEPRFHWLAAEFPFFHTNGARERFIKPGTPTHRAPGGQRVERGARLRRGALFKCRRNVRMAEIVPLEQQGLAQRSRQGVGEAVAENKLGGVPAALSDTA